MPIIPITIRHHSQSAKVEAYVDSGAFYSILSMEVARGLDLNLNHAKKRTFVVGDGNQISTRILKLAVEIGTQSFLADVAFSEELRVGFNLLGRRSIFEHFEEVVFQERKKKILFRFNP